MNHSSDDWADHHHHRYHLLMICIFYNYCILLLLFLITITINSISCSYSYSDWCSYCSYFHGLGWPVLLFLFCWMISSIFALVNTTIITIITTIIIIIMIIVLATSTVVITILVLSLLLRIIIIIISNSVNIVFYFHRSHVGFHDDHRHHRCRHCAGKSDLAATTPQLHTGTNSNQVFRLSMKMNREPEVLNVKNCPMTVRLHSSAKSCTCMIKLNLKS